MEKYKLTVGLEIHAELSTRTKMFCNSRNNPDEVLPNVNICPVCMGYPGTLPVINKEAVRSILRLGLAVGGEFANYTEFDRKNYFYPDIPKGYQISQYKHPLISGGSIGSVKLTRIHLEEDTASSSHEGGESSLVDFNRAGVPLMEMVTEPVINSAEEATAFAKELQLLLRTLDISKANMEKGEMRVEANISVAKIGAKEFGTKVEVKNLNSFRAVGKAIEFEYLRQCELLERGEQVLQETRGWDENKSETFSQRIKEESHDYRYFPDPDLPKLFISEIPEFAQHALKEEEPELPWVKRERYKALGITDEHAEIYVSEFEWGQLFEAISRILKDSKLIQLASNYIASDLKTPIAPESLAEIIIMITNGEVSSRGAKEILKEIQVNGGEPKKIATEKKLMQINDKSELKKIVEEVLSEKSDAPIQYLVGQAIKKSGGRANPAILQELFVEMLNR